LHASGRDVADLSPVRDLHLPARRLQPVADPDRAAHHLHACPHLDADREHQTREAVLVGRHHPSPLIAPPSPTAHHAARQFAQSTEILHRGAPFTRLSYRPTLSLLREALLSRRTE
jgi:hypothetical protein